MNFHGCRRLANRASSVIESPGRTTWVRAQTIAALETSLSTLTATKTFSERLSLYRIRWGFWLAIKLGPLIEQLVVLSIYLSRHTILSTYDGDHIRWHVMFGHRIESLWMGRARCSYFTTVGTIASITDQKDTKFSFRCFNCGIGRRSWYGKTFCIKFEMVNWGRVDRWSCSHLAGYWKKKLASASPII